MGDRALALDLAHKGIRDARVLEAIAALDRRAFLSAEQAGEAQGNYPLPIGYGQTISQPFVVAYMSEALQLKPNDRVLEIGTGSAYQTAVLALLCAEVYSVEIVPELASQAADRVQRLGFLNIQLRQGDGFYGWPEAAPFDAIVLTAAPAEVPAPLLAQLGAGGRLVAPVGGASDAQDLVRTTRRSGGALVSERLIPVRFVPMTGEAEPG